MYGLVILYKTGEITNTKNHIKPLRMYNLNIAYPEFDGHIVENILTSQSPVSTC